MPSTVKELIERLQTLDPDLKVLTAIDEEGNGFNEVHLPWVGVSWYDGETLIADEDVGTEYEESELTKVVVI